MSETSSFLETTIFSPINYEEIKYVCLCTLSSKPNEENYKNIIPRATEENLNNINILIPLEKKGGPESGRLTVADMTLNYGKFYEKDDHGNLVLDDSGSPILLEDYGVLYGFEVPEEIKNMKFNSIICYSKSIDQITNSNVIAFVTVLNNSLPFIKLVNFYINYVLNTEIKLIELILNYKDEYKTHSINSNNSYNILKSLHPNTVAYSITSNKEVDDYEQMTKDYSLFLKESEFLYIKPVPEIVKENNGVSEIYEGSFDSKLEKTVIQTKKDTRLFKFDTKNIKTSYVYFYYNIYSARRMCIEGIINEYENIEDPEEFYSIPHETLRRHIKLGFSENSGPFLYTWLSTSKFIYVIVFGSNSNNNIDIYRMRNRLNENINATDFNLVVGKYLNRIYFTINNNLYVCVPEIKEKQKTLINKKEIDDAKKILDFKDILYVDENIKDNELKEHYDTLIKDINENNSTIYLLSLEQLYIFILQKNNDYAKYITNGSFLWNGDYTPPEDLEPDDPKNNPPDTAKKFFEWNLYKNGSLDRSDYFNIYKYIINPINKINIFKKYIDDLVIECDKYKEDKKTDSVKVEYINQICKKLRDNLKPDFSLTTTYREMWEGINGDTGVKNNVLNFYLSNGIIEGESKNSNKYDNYIENCFLTSNDYNIVDLIENVEFRVWISNPTGNTSMLTYFYQNIRDRLKLKDPSYDLKNSYDTFSNYYNNLIFNENNDIINIETNFRKCFKYSTYEDLYNFMVNSTINASEYVIRIYLINKETEGSNNPNTIDSLKTKSIKEINELWENNYINPLKENIIGEEWWNETILTQLENIYFEITQTECFDTISYGNIDEFYYNGELKENFNIIKRDSEIPFNYGFPYPSYIYNSKTYKGFIIQEHEAESVEKTFSSKIVMEEELKIPKRDGTSENLDELKKLTKLTPSIRVKKDSDIEKLTTIKETVETKELLNKRIIISEEIETEDDLPPAGEEGDVIKIISTDTYKIYKGLLWEDYIFPVEGDIFLVQEDYKYYKLILKEDELIFEEYSFPVMNTIALSEESLSFFRYNGTTWDKITQEEYEKEFENKIYFVEDTSFYYKFVNKGWIKIDPVYDIDITKIYKVTNEKETIIESVELIDNEVDTGFSSFFIPTKITKYSINIYNLTNSDNDQGKKNIIIKYETSEEIINKEIDFKDGDTINNLTIEFEVERLEKIIISSEKIDVMSKNLYTWERDPGDTGIKYYKWNGVDFINYNMEIIPEQNSCNFLIDKPVYFNIYIEGDKLNIINDLFKNEDGETLKVIQFEFSFLGDVVLVLNYNNRGQDIWGGVFSRASNVNIDGSVKTWGYSVVMDNDFKKCFNWDSYNEILFKEVTEGVLVNGDVIEKSYSISDERILAIEATYEVSRSHYNVLKDRFDISKIIFSNALTVAIEKQETGEFLSKLYVYPKNIKMPINLLTIPYNDTRIYINNYFIILRELWIDSIFNKRYKMNSSNENQKNIPGTENGSKGDKNHYLNHFLTANCSSVITSLTPHSDGTYPDEMNGAVTFFNGNVWYDRFNVKSEIEINGIPKIDI